MKYSSVIHAARSAAATATLCFSAIALQADSVPNPKCSVAQFNGWYGMAQAGFEAGAPVPGASDVPSAFIGVIYADGKGKIPVFKGTFTGNYPEPFGALVVQRDFGEGGINHFSDITYTVSDDCQGVIRFVAQFEGIGQLPTEARFVVVDGGREAMILRTEALQSGLGLLKRLDSSRDDDLDKKLSELSEQLDAIQRVVRLLAVRHGFAPE